METLFFIYVYTVAGSKAKHTIEGFDFHNGADAIEFMHGKNIHSVTECIQHSNGFLEFVADYKPKAFKERIRSEIELMEFSI